MDLRAYFEAGCDTQAGLARKIGRDKSLITKVLSGDARFSPEMAKQVEEVTGGRVKRSTLRPDIWEAAA